FLEEDGYIDFHAEEVARVEAINKIEKACPYCYRRQPPEHETCRLCGERPDTWLPSVPPPLRTDRLSNIIDDSGNVIATGKQAGAMRVARLDDNWKRWAATSASVDELTYIVSHFASPTDGWQIKHAARILRLLGEIVPLDFYGHPVHVDIRTPA